MSLVWYSGYNGPTSCQALTWALSLNWRIVVRVWAFSQTVHCCLSYQWLCKQRSGSKQLELDFEQEVFRDLETESPWTYTTSWGGVASRQWKKLLFWKELNLRNKIKKNILPLAESSDTVRYFASIMFNWEYCRLCNSRNAFWRPEACIKSSS